MNRIALVVPSLADEGGIPTYAHFLYKQLQSTRRYEVDLISLASSTLDSASTRLLKPGAWFRGPKIVTAEWRDICYRHVGAHLVELEFQRYRPRQVLTELLQEYDLIQVVSGSPVWALAVQGCSKPVCLAVATLTQVERKSRLSKERGLKQLWLRLMTCLTGLLDARAVLKVNMVFVINRWMDEYLRKSIDPSKVVLAPPGVDTGFFHPQGYRPNGCILSVGRLLDPRKNVRLLLEAYAALLRQCPFVPDLALAGKTMPGAPDMEYAEQLGISARVKLYADVTQVELRDLYQSASLFVLSSDEEGLGIVILEAMASGLPVVATRCGGPETVVRDGETGLLTPAGGAAALTSAMSELLTDPDRRDRMGRLARQVAEESFSLSVTFQPYLDVYDRLSGPSRVADRSL